MPYLTCQTCKNGRWTSKGSIECQSCRTQRVHAENYAKYVDKLTVLGYTLHTLPGVITNNKTKVDVTNHTCGHRYTVRLQNLASQASKCVVCGPTKRAAVALVGYMKKHGRDTYGGKEFDDYQWHVRKLSNRTYDKHIDIINPLRHLRAKAGSHPDAWNLDHVIPIIECFKRGWTIEQAAALTNLQMLPARENLRKRATVK